MIFNNTSYTINYSNILEDNQLLSVTKLLAKNIMETSYSNTGKFIKGLSDGDLYALLDTIEDGHPHQFEDLIIISEMLSIGEGCDAAKDEAETMNRISALSGFLTIESLHRKGFVKVYHENMSFHEDCGNKIVVEKL